MATRGQVKRAMIAADFYARTRFKRGKEYPKCVTCGSTATHEFAKGEPAYGCGPHDPLRISDVDLERGRQELRRQ